MARISTRNLAQLCRRTGTSLRAGIDVRRIWEQEAQRGGAAQREHASRISRRIARGDTLAEAMRDTGGFFPPLTCEMVDVGEQTGRLEEVLLRLADHYDHMLSLRRLFLLGIFWPATELGLAIAIIGFLIWVMGVIAPSEGATVRIFGLAGNSGLTIYIGFIALVGGALTLGVVGLMKNWFGPGPLQLVMRLPAVGSLLQTIALARLSWSLAMALESGVDARQSIRLALRSTQNPYYTRYLDQVDQVVLHGGEFHEALRDTGAFPHEFLDALQNAELSGTHGESLMSLSREYQERAQAMSRVFTTVSTIAIWGMVAMLLIMLIFQFFFQFILNPINQQLDELSWRLQR